MTSAAESALVVPVPAATQLVTPWRERFDASAVHGVPAHVTVLYPFVVPDELSPTHDERLSALFAEIAPFDFTLGEVGWFGEDVVYLVPAPAAPFVELTRRVVEVYPEHPPYLGLFDEIVPHLTVGDHAPVAELRRAARAVETHLPITARASDVWLMIASGSGTWRVHARFELGGSPI